MQDIKKSPAQGHEGDLQKSSLSGDDKEKHSTDAQKVLRYLLSQDSGISFQIEKACAVRYCPDVIQNIEKKGVKIDRTPEKYTRQDGKQSRVVRYSINPKSAALAARLSA